MTGDRATRAQVERQEAVTATWLKWRKSITYTPTFAEQLEMLGTIGRAYDRGQRG